MSEKQEKIMVWIITAIFAAVLIADAVLDYLHIQIPGLFSFGLCVCAVICLVMMLKSPKKRRVDIILISLAALISAVYGVFQIIL